MINRKTKKKLRRKNYLKHKLEKVMRQRHRYNKKKKCKSKAINFLPKIVQSKRNTKIVELLKKEKFIKKVRRKSKMKCVDLGTFHKQYINLLQKIKKSPRNKVKNYCK